MLVDDNQLTVLTDPHRKVMDILEKMGVGLMEEVDFPPYRIDLYLPDYHVAVEIDGPMHSKRQDLKRDMNLSLEYWLPTFRIAHNQTHPRYWSISLKVFLESSLQTRNERWEKAEMKVPWL